MTPEILSRNKEETRRKLKTKRWGTDMKLGGQEWRENESERGQGGGREHSSRAGNQSKKSIFNLAVRMAKLAYQQCYQGLNYTKLPSRKGR